MVEILSSNIKNPTVIHMWIVNEFDFQKKSSYLSEASILKKEQQLSL